MTNEQPTTRRQRRTLARKAQILDAAAKVFAEKGFHRATTKEIADAADVSEGTIYNYFDSKEDLLIGIMGQLAEVETLPEELMGALQSDVRDFFVAIFRQRIGRMQQAQKMIQALLPEVMVNLELRERYYQQFVLRVATILEQYIEARIEMGHIRPVDAALAARAVQGMFVGLILLRLLGDEPVLSRWEEVPEVVATMIFDGLRPRKGG
ncbi:MAG: TetR/AcrR family transcriptional regulator [Anaerolineae bacterium]